MHNSAAEPNKHQRKRRGGNLTGEHGGDRAVEGKGVATPTFQETEKVLAPPAEVAATRGHNARNDCGIDRGRSGDAGTHCQRAIGVGPVWGQNRNGIGDKGSGHRGRGVSGAEVCSRGIKMAFDVKGIESRHGEPYGRKRLAIDYGNTGFGAGRLGSEICHVENLWIAPKEKSKNKVILYEFLDINLSGFDRFIFSFAEKSGIGIHEWADERPWNGNQETIVSAAPGHDSAVRDENDEIRFIVIALLAHE